MNGFSNNHFAETMAQERSEDTAARARMARLMAEAGVDHPVRRRFSLSLIHLGLRIAPQNLEIVTTSRTSQAA